jgi:hypothetical protein
LSAFSEPPSDATWLENARLLDRIFRVAKVMPLGLKMLACWIAFSESPSETTWLENALFRLNPRRLDLARPGFDLAADEGGEFLRG